MTFSSVPRLEKSPPDDEFGKKVKVKVKLSLCFNSAPHHEGVLGKWMYSSTHSLTLALDGREWSASRPGRFTSSERTLVPIG
jgi:hypothetical protein